MALKQVLGKVPHGQYPRSGQFHPRTTVPWTIALLPPNSLPCHSMLCDGASVNFNKVAVFRLATLSKKEKRDSIEQFFLENTSGVCFLLYRNKKQAPDRHKHYCYFWLRSLMLTHKQPPEVFCKKGFLKNFVKIHWKTPEPEPHF